MKENSKKEISRREFIKLSALGLASLTILPSWIAVSYTHLRAHETSV